MDTRRPIRSVAGMMRKQVSLFEARLILPGWATRSCEGHERGPGWGSQAG